MNTLILVGNLTADPQLRYTANGVAVASFTVAYTKKFLRDGEWADGDTLFMNCSVWRDMAEHVASSLTKGLRVMVTGQLRQRSYETEEGEKRTVFELDVEDVGPSLKFAGALVKSNPRSPKPEPQSEDPWVTGSTDYPDDTPF